MKVIISGASKGIGNACGLLFKSKGYEVINIDIGSSKDFKTYIGSISYEELIKKVSNEVGKVDVIIANASIQDVKPLKETTPADFKKIIDVNLCGTYSFIYHLLNNIEDNGKILIMSSVHSDIPRLNKYAYDASKAGLNILTKELALSLANRKINVNALLLGATLTPMNQELVDNPTLLKLTAQKTAFKEIMSPEKVAKVAYLIVQEEFSNMTGSLLTLDNGRSLIN